MKERCKIFSAADVVAIREGRKTMFREMVVPQPPTRYDRLFRESGGTYGWWHSPSTSGQGAEQQDLLRFPKSPFGTIGDRIWIPEAHQFLRETCSYECEEYDLFEWEHDLYGSPKDHLLAKCPRGGHRAIIGYADEEDMEDWEMRPSIAMPRWACRTFAEITAVRVERVADISHEDAISEGCIGAGWKVSDNTHPVVYPAIEFSNLWQSRCGNWDANPFVWVYSIKIIKP